MTAPDRYATVMARLDELRALCIAVGDGYPAGPLVERLSGVWSMFPQEAVFIAAFGPDLLLRVVTAAQDTLRRHARWGTADALYCEVCAEPEWIDTYTSWPCTEVTAVLDTWEPI